MSDKTLIELQESLEKNKSVAQNEFKILI